MTTPTLFDLLEDANIDPQGFSKAHLQNLETLVRLVRLHTTMDILELAVDGVISAELVARNLNQ